MPTFCTPSLASLLIFRFWIGSLCFSQMKNYNLCLALLRQQKRSQINKSFNKFKNNQGTNNNCQNYVKIKHYVSTWCVKHIVLKKIYILWLTHIFKAFFYCCHHFTPYLCILHMVSHTVGSWHPSVCGVQNEDFDLWQRHLQLN